jgi:hypothetical protein
LGSLQRLDIGGQRFDQCRKLLQFRNARVPLICGLSVTSIGSASVASVGFSRFGFALTKGCKMVESICVPIRLLWERCVAPTTNGCHVWPLVDPAKACVPARTIAVSAINKRVRVQTVLAICRFDILFLEITHDSEQMNNKFIQFQILFLPNCRILAAQGGNVDKAQD